MKGTATTCALALGTVLWSSNAVHAESLPVTVEQRATAQQVAQQGVPLTALSPNAPESYTVKKGDTLWHISGLFLRQPWHWPELWGMNLDAIANPHLIYPGQVLYLERVNGYARLRTSRPGELETVKLSPRTRDESLADLALPTLQMHLIEPFLSEPLVVDSDTVAAAPRIIATNDQRMLLGQGDKAYVRGTNEAPFIHKSGSSRQYRLFRQATPLKDPISGEILGYEAQYLGRAELERGEKVTGAEANGDNAAIYTPGTIRLHKIKEEVRAGDRLLPEPPRQFSSFVPHAPQGDVEAHVVSLYGGSALRYGTQHQVVAINKGTADGIQPGTVLSLITKGRKIVDKTDSARPTVQLPDEENGLGIVFRSFDRVSYVLIMDVQRGVEVGDLLISPLQ